MLLKRPFKITLKREDSVIEKRPSQKPLDVLLIEDDSTTASLIIPLLQSKFDVRIQHLSTIQSAIELLEGPWLPADLIICDYHGASQALLKCMLDFCQKVPCILIAEEGFKVSDLSRIRGAYLVDPVNRKFLSRELIERITGLEEKGEFRKGDGANDEPRLDAKSKALVEQQSQKIESALADPSPNEDQARATATESLQIIQDLTTKMGFAPEVRKIAAKSVELSLKVVGSKPRLSSIIANLKKYEGQYLASHAIMLAEISCATACRVGWNSATTYFKLTLAAYLHDIVVRNNDIAKCRSLEEAKQLVHVPEDDRFNYRLHPTRAAEFSRRFHEIPPDVDTIIAQHHEKPDGTGFPRGLFQSQLAPLSCVFIVAEELLHFYLREGAEGSMTKFAEEHSEEFKSGVFRKIMRALVDDPKSL